MSGIDVLNVAFRTNLFGIFLKSVIEGLGVANQNAITTVIFLFQYPVDVVVNVAACMVMPKETRKHCFVVGNENSSFLI